MSNKLTRKKLLLILMGCIVLFLTNYRIDISTELATSKPGDGRTYTLLAKNLFEQKSFSISTEPPFEPTLLRMPGYPLFMATVYSVFGLENNIAVRKLQGILDLITCLIITYLVWLWTDDEKRKWRNSASTFFLIFTCPFIVIYTGAILTETIATLFLAVILLTSTFAFKSERKRNQAVWWSLTGIVSGCSVYFRPDSALFALAVGLTLIISELFFHRLRLPQFSARIFYVFWKGTVFCLAFIVVLIPWTIRNYSVFGVFQPIAPKYAVLPGESIAIGYKYWQRTWVEDGRFIEPLLYDLNRKELKIEIIPESAFDSPEEKARVAALFEKYNKPAENNESLNQPQKNNDSEFNRTQLKMTDEIDSEFNQIAFEKISRSPIRYYFWLPVKRAASMWFDSHSLYYPFGIDLSKTDTVEFDDQQLIWIPFFKILTWVYTFLAIGGVWIIWRERQNRNILRWGMLSLLVIFLRIAFFSTLENPEPRYVVPLFAITAILGGYFLGSFEVKKGFVQN